MITWKAPSSIRASTQLARAARLVCCVAALSACDDGNSSPREDSGDMATPRDAGAEAEDAGAAPDDDAAPDGDTNPPDGDADEATDGGHAEVDVPTQPGAPCQSKEDCDDRLFCNGEETCEPAAGSDRKVCKPGIPPLDCTREHPCMEELRACDCRNPDSDNDGDGAKICLDNKTVLLKAERYLDCDDGDPARCSSFKEQCDNRDVDEDCNTETFGQRDQDGDGSYDATCRNWDTQGKPHGGDDCDDHNPNFHPRAQEICDYYDNDCNGFIDETHFSAAPDDFEHKDGGQRELLLPDQDRDGHGKAGVPPTLLCRVTEQEGLVVATASRDCDDTNPHTYEGAPEICDGLDNDCDGKVDADDVKDANSEGLQLKYAFTATTVSCVAGEWTIPKGGCPSADVQWCGDRDPIEQGCRTDATRLTSCRDCTTSCKLSCGEHGCDEVAGIGAGTFHACAITNEAHAVCWGRGNAGQTGNDSLTNSPVPLTVAALPPVASIASGLAHTCAITATERDLYCWGADESGQLGSDQAVNATGFSAAPLRVSGGSLFFDPITLEVPEFLTNVVSVSLGAAHTCAVLGTGEVACWGQQDSGRLGNKLLTAAIRAIPVVPLDDQDGPIINGAEVSVGQTHSCIRTLEGTVGCWGDNQSGQLGRDPQLVARSAVMLPVPALEGVTSISSGLAHVCALVGGEVFCWGDNQRLQLGRPASATLPRSTPSKIPGLAGVIALDCGDSHCCALGSDGQMRCWGSNDSGQLGRAPSADSDTPSLVGLSEVRSFSVGNRFTCAVTASKIAYCWGDGRYGKLGNGSVELKSQATPTPVKSLLGSRP